jgi:hypothetical protein
MCEKEVSRKISGPNRDEVIQDLRKLQIILLENLYFSSNFKWSMNPMYYKPYEAKSETLVPTSKMTATFLFRKSVSQEKNPCLL